jgi:hypothetical protein
VILADDSGLEIDASVGTRIYSAYATLNRLPDSAVGMRPAMPRAAELKGIPAEKRTARLLRGCRRDGRTIDAFHRQ